MRKISFTIIIAILAFLGSILLFVPFEDDRGLWWIEQHLKIIQEQLASIKQHLLDYKAKHGTFPSNDDGLAVLDNFESRFKIVYYRDPDEIEDFSTGFYVDRYCFWWQSRKRALQEFKDKFGRAPKNTEEFAETKLGMDLEMGIYPDEDCLKFEVEIALGKNNEIFLMHPDGILSPWLIPYNYENRRGLESSLFKDSPVNYDEENQYSLCVDEDIFIYSTGGSIYARKLEKLQWERNRPKYFGAVLISLSIILTFLGILLKVKGKTLRALLISGLAGLGLGYGGHFMSYATCYIMSPLFFYRNPEMVVQQKELLEKQYRRGIIKEETYRKALSALEPDLKKNTEEK